MSLDVIDSSLVPSLMLQVTEKEDEFQDVATALQHEKWHDVRCKCGFTIQYGNSNKRCKGLCHDAYAEDNDVLLIVVIILIINLSNDLKLSGRRSLILKYELLD